MKQRIKEAHMQVAEIYANLSYCERKKVGCVVVKDERIISIGYNGTPSGWDNCCEDIHGNTKEEVSHAEENAILKLARSSDSGEGATFFITCSPCLRCARMIAKLRPAAVYYGEVYKDTAGIDHLKEHNFIIEKLEI